MIVYIKKNGVKSISEKVIPLYKPVCFISGEVSQSDSEMDGQMRQQEEKEKTDQSQQTTPTTPPSSGKASVHFLSSYLVSRKRVKRIVTGLNK